MSKYSLKAMTAYLDSLIETSTGEEKALLTAIKERLNPGNSKFKLYQHFMAAWSDWYKGKVGLVPRITAADGKALNEIITYLVQASPDKTEDRALHAWQMILEHWNRLSPFLQDHKRLLQIAKYIDEIADKVKNGRSYTTVREASEGNNFGTLAAEVHQRRRNKAQR